jgi:hypothetical protein
MLLGRDKHRCLLAILELLGHGRLWVKNGSVRARAARPFYPQEQTLPKPTGLTRLREDHQSAPRFETGRDQPSCAVPTQQDWPGDTLDRHATA